LINVRTNLNNFTVDEFRRDSDKDQKPAAPTLNFSGCRASCLLLDRVTRRQLGTLRKSNSIQRELLERSASRNKALVDCQRNTDQQAVLQLAEDGFARLSINRGQE
jgi:hypothetical protein